MNITIMTIIIGWFISYNSNHWLIYNELTMTINEINKWLQFGSPISAPSDDDSLLAQLHGLGDGDGYDSIE